MLVAGKALLGAKLPEIVLREIPIAALLSLFCCRYKTCCYVAYGVAALQLDERIGAVVLGWDCLFNYQKVRAALSASRASSGQQQQRQ